jgi:2-amino-4-hydroxy-6-hydroxymethyldihydropteridine diphosphokinase
VNAVVAVRTALGPRALLAALQSIERDQHRRRDGERPRNAPRTLDLDLLLYGRRRLRVPGLTVPHPRMHERAFVLRPLTDIAAVATIPGRGLARRFLRAVRSQRIARTRTHFPH